MQKVPSSYSENEQLCPAGKVLETKMIANREHFDCLSSRIEKALEKIQKQLDKLNENTINDYNKIESLNTTLKDIKTWKESTDKFHTLFAEHLATHKDDIAKHRKMIINWGLFSGTGAAAAIDGMYRFIHMLSH